MRDPLHGRNAPLDPDARLVPLMVKVPGWTRSAIDEKARELRVSRSRAAALVLMAAAAEAEKDGRWASLDGPKPEGWASR